MSHLKIPDTVAAAFAEKTFKSWADVTAFADSSVKKRYGWDTDRINFETRISQAFLSGSRPELDAAEAYMNLSMGSRYLAAANVPFPQSSGLLLSLTDMEPLLKPLEVADKMTAIWSGFIIMAESAPASRAGKEAADIFYKNAVELKKIVPGTTLEIISSSFPINLQQILVPPDVRTKADELLSLAINGSTIPAVVSEGERYSLN